VKGRIVIRVQSLHVYPVKSCAGIELGAARVERRGLEADRRWMIVGEDGRFVTQREEPRLCLVRTTLDGDRLVLSYEGDTFELPRALAEGPRTTVEVWKSRVDAIEHAPARAWISRATGIPARLVYMPDDVERAVSPTYAAPSDVVSFADGFPVLLASTGSLAELERRANQTLSMTRFRPNVVVACDEPFAEDGWKRLAIGEATFRAPKGCDRCVVTTVDPTTGVRGKEPLRTLATFRKWDEAVWFAVNLVPDTLGTITVGDEVRVLDGA
jgi:uncharacterized protein